MAGKGKDSHDSRVIKLALVGGESKPTNKGVGSNLSMSASGRAVNHWRLFLHCECLLLAVSRGSHYVNLRLLNSRYVIESRRSKGVDFNKLKGRYRPQADL